MPREIRKYYKDFNPETVFNNKNKIEVTRFILYLDTEMLIFVDYSDEENIKGTKEFLANSTGTLRVDDIFSAPSKRELYVPYDDIMMAEVNEGLILTEQDFEMDNVEALEESEDGGC